METTNMKNTTISRKIAEGQYVNFELTDAEMESAFNEYQFQMDILTIKSRIKESGEYENWEDIPDDIIYDMAKRYREHMTGFAETMGDNSFPSAEATIKEFADKLDEYREKWKVFSKEVTLTLTKEYTIKAKNKEDAERIFEAWSESRHGMDQIMCELTEDVQYDGDWRYGYAYEEDASVCDPDNADISEEDV